jgi:hypothetical protein
MRRRYGMAALTTVALGAAGLWALPAAGAGGGGGGGHDDDHGDDSFRVMAHEVDSVDLDLGEPGFGLGDRFVFTEDLVKRGKVVGSDHGECTVTRMEGETGWLQCVVTAVFHGKGQLTVQGAFRFSETAGARFVLPITGGSGKFTGASGVVVVDENEEPSSLTFKLD